MSDRNKKRDHLRNEDGDIASIKHSRGDPMVELKIYNDRNKKITDELADGLKTNSREKVQLSLKKRDKLTNDALREMKRRDRTIAKDAFLPISSATAGIDERIVEKAMANGSANYQANYETVPLSLRNPTATDLQPEKVQHVAVELIVSTQALVKLNDKNLDQAFKNIPPVTDDQIILEVFNQITPQNRNQLEDDMAKFYTYISITSPDPTIDSKIIGPALARSYVNYRATLMALQIRSS